MQFIINKLEVVDFSQSPLPLIPRGGPEFPNPHYPLSPEGAPSSPVPSPKSKIVLAVSRRRDRVL
ncbi:hypothetical protein FDUTEX481_03743 [Tolypothrix sp. PCC 7601]|nr:hypothetical protein FDUTEX481_03743 [Tolypothrix sp. PCC 7601]BAY90361.1 hypothetical protein NIES3275_23730 [Microchaete diplosiphon NIES-3275]